MMHVDDNWRVTLHPIAFLVLSFLAGGTFGALIAGL